MLIAALLFACATSAEPTTHGEAAVAGNAPTPATEGAHHAEEAGHHEEEAATAAPPDADGWSSYGAAPTLASAQPAADLLADPAKYADQTVRVQGKVSSVCQMAGCWLVLADDQGHQLRVTMKEHSFGVPKDSSGRLADIEGLVVQKKVDPKLVEHYKSEGDGGAVPEEGKTEQAEIVATSVRLRAS